MCVCVCSRGHACTVGSQLESAERATWRRRLQNRTTETQRDERELRMTEGDSVTWIESMSQRTW